MENIRQFSIIADRKVTNAAANCRRSRVRSYASEGNWRRKAECSAEYLSPDEARRLIEAAGDVGRQRERDKLLLNLMYRHGLRVSEAIDLRWTDFDLDVPKARPFWVRRLKGSKDRSIP